MRKKEMIILTIIVLIIVSLFVFSNSQEPPEPTEFVKNKTVVTYSNLFFNYEILKYPSNVEITSLKNINESIVLGLVTDPWNINFGIIPGNGTFVKRNIELTNKEEKDIKIILRSYGNISPLVVFSKNDFILKPKEKASIDIFLYSKNAEPGNYSGEIDVISQKGI